MFNYLSKYFLPVIFLSVSLLSTPALTNKVGTVTGGIPHDMPSWFKDSFLEFADDVAEASEENKHVIIFLHLNNCPYCALMAEDFDANKAFITKHFDTIAINIKGDREIALNDMESFTERELAQMLGVQYTPTILFLNTENTIVARANGYRTPQRMQMMFDFVRNKAYTSSTFVEYAENLKTDFNYSFIQNKRFQPIKDLSGITGPLAVVFEDDACFGCEYFHTTTLANADVNAELDKYTIVRLNAKSDEMITTPSGKQMSMKAFANDLALTYRPGVVLFDDGKEQSRIDGFLYTYHFATMLRYVANGNYKAMTFSDYLGARREELTSRGIDINLAK